MIQKQKLIDLMGGDESMANRFIDLFKSQVPGELNTLDNQVRERDFEGASVTAHGIKSQCGYLGLEEAAACCLLIEKRAEAEDRAFDFHAAAGRLRNLIEGVLTG